MSSFIFVSTQFWPGLHAQTSRDWGWDVWCDRPHYPSSLFAALCKQVLIIIGIYNVYIHLIYVTYDIYIFVSIWKRHEKHWIGTNKVRRQKLFVMTCAVASWLFPDQAFPVRTLAGDVQLLGKTLYSHSASLCPGSEMVPANCKLGLNLR